MMKKPRMNEDTRLIWCAVAGSWERSPANVSPSIPGTMPSTHMTRKILLLRGLSESKGNVDAPTMPQMSVMRMSQRSMWVALSVLLSLAARPPLAALFRAVRTW